MADNYYDMTGTITLDKVTPVIKALFGPFELDENYPGDGTVYIANIAENSNCSWDEVLDNLQVLASSLGLTPPGNAERNVENYFRVLARHFGVDKNPEIDRLIEDKSFDGEASVETLFALALHFDDGHGIKAVQTEGSWHCSRPHLGAFGGCGEFHGRHVSVARSSQQAARLGDELDAALDANQFDRAAQCILDDLTSTLNGVASNEARRATTSKLRELLSKVN